MNPAEPLPMPENLVRAAESEGHQLWLTIVLPAVIRQAQHMWSLTIGPPFQPGGQTAWVAPARDAAGADLVLKVAWPHPEAAREADGLRAWAGQGAVRLHAAYDFGEAHALLIERSRRGRGLARLAGRARCARCARCCPRRIVCRDIDLTVTRGWQAGEFWRVGPGKSAWVGENKTRPPPRMR
jgi:GNAT superfamily N-acetyltransferase